MSGTVMFCQQPGCTKYANDKVDGVRYCRQHARAAGLRPDQIPRDKRWRQGEASRTVTASSSPAVRGPRYVRIGREEFLVTWDGTF